MVRVFVEKEVRLCQISHEQLIRHITCRFAATFPRSCDREIGGDWAGLFQCLRKHDMHGVLELLSAFVDDHGGVSLPAFLGCMRALFEASESGFHWNYPLRKANAQSLGH